MTESTTAPDALAGIVGLFGALRPEELHAACTELTYKRTGAAPGDAAIESAIEAALETHHLVAHEEEGETIYVSGPAAFPTLPEFADDLPHLLDIPTRSPDRDAVARSLVAELAEERGAADEPRREELAQLSYDIEAWADVDADVLRE